MRTARLGSWAEVDLGKKGQRWRVEESDMELHTGYRSHTARRDIVVESLASRDRKGTPGNLA